MYDNIAILATFLPLVSSFLAGILFRTCDYRIANTITISGVSISLACSLMMLMGAIDGSSTNLSLMPFMPDLGSYWTLKIDSVAASMYFTVTLVSLVVHVYSTGYMSRDESRQKFMSYLSLFTFFMLILVSSADLLQLFVGWEGVGMCSYLLIGFWHQKESANDAAIKAFVVNRVADVALVASLCVLYKFTGTLSISGIREALLSQNSISGQVARTPFLGVSCDYVTLAAIMMFIGCMGKSAQVGLHVWLPDAMEGPTPVSALIHAATMVTAGVLLLSKMYFMFELSSVARSTVLIVGSVTALMAAIIATFQDDIKKIIAYSTCSQLGYMFIACGTSAYAASVFHLVMHAFFKALLFLCAGSVIHAVNGEQNIFKMGGLRKKIPVTFVLMLIGSIAIAGFPPFSGFFSKDAIIESAYVSGQFGSGFAFCSSVLAALLTAFYSWRLLALVFHGQTRLDDRSYDVVHESPGVMLNPLYVLAALSSLAGFLSSKYLHILSGDTGSFFREISPFASENVLLAIHSSHDAIPYYIKLLPIAVSTMGVIFGYILYLKVLSPGSIERLRGNMLTQIGARGFYFNEIYSILFVKPYFCVAKFCANYIERVVDFVFVGLWQSAAVFLSYLSSRLNSGRHWNYLFWNFVVICLIFAYFFFRGNEMPFLFNIV